MNHRRAWCMKIRMKIEPQLDGALFNEFANKVDTWIPQDPPVWIKIPQLSSPLSSAPAHPSAQLQLPLLIGDDESLSIPQNSSAQLTSQISSSSHLPIGTTTIHVKYTCLSFSRWGYSSK